VKIVPCSWCSGPIHREMVGTLFLDLQGSPGESSLGWHTDCASRDPLLRAIMRPRSSPASDGEIRLIQALAQERQEKRRRSHDHDQDPSPEDLPVRG
jgi:hypothetical protein